MICVIGLVQWTGKINQKMGRGLSKKGKRDGLIKKIVFIGNPINYLIVIRLVLVIGSCFN